MKQDEKNEVAPKAVLQEGEKAPRKDVMGYEIKTINNLIRRRIDNVTVFSEEITGMHGWIIGFIYHNQKNRDIFQRDIESEFLIRRSTATGMLQLMEKNDLIIREPVAYDARLKKIVLTPKAVAYHKAIVNELDQMEEQLRKGLTQEEIEEFFRLIRKIKKNIE